MTTNQVTKFGPALSGAVKSRPMVKANSRLSRNVQLQIGQRLKAFYDALALSERPVPDRLVEIIGRLNYPEN